MNEPVAKTVDEGLERPGSLSPDKVLSVVIESAVSAAVQTFLVILFGSLAIGIVGQIWKDMTPSAPPGYTVKAEREANFRSNGMQTR